MKEKKVVAIVQARMGSSRLSGKVLKPLGGSTVLESLINRLKNSSTIDQIVIATSIEKEMQKSLSCLKTVISKFLKVQKMMSLVATLNCNTNRCRYYCRSNRNCPLIDPKLVDDCVNKIIDSNLDYVSNCNNVEKPLPDGFDVEVFTMDSLN